MTRTLDKKSKDILKQLDLDARQSDSKISKKVGLSKQVVNYRIKKLEENKIIDNYYTIIDVSKLGYNQYYVFFQTKNINKKQETEFIDFLKKLNNGWIVLSTGKWDIITLIFARNGEEFKEHLNKIFSKYGHHIFNYEISIMVESKHIGYKHITNKDTGSVIQKSINNTYSLSKKEYLILKELSQNARMPLTELSAKLNIPITQISYTLKKLKSIELIKSFKPKLNIHKLELQWYLLLVRLNYNTKNSVKKLKEFCNLNKNVYYVTYTIGTYDIMLDIHVRSINEFRDFLNHFKEVFYQDILYYETNVILKEEYINYLPLIK